GIRKLRATPTALLEVGPGSTLTQLARQHPAAGAEPLVVASMPEQSDGEREDQSILAALGQLWMHGTEAKWSELNRNAAPPRRVSLPPYPFERKSFWTEYPFEKTMTNPTSIADAHTVSNDKSEMTEDLSTIPSMNPMQTEKRHDRIVTSLQAIFADLSGLDMATLDKTSGFLELGFDSLFLTQVSQAIQGKFRIKITFRQLLDKLSTIEALAQHLDTSLPPDSAPEPVQESPETQQILVTPSSNGTSNKTAPATIDSSSGLEGLFRSQLQTLTELMNKQLEVLRATPMNGFAPARAEAAAASSGTVKAAQVDIPPVSAPLRPAMLPQSRRFVPFGAVEAGSGSDLSAAQKQYLTEFIERYNRKTGGSKGAAQEYRRYMADPRAASGFRVEWKELIYPIVTVRSKGSKPWDVDGNEYVDMVNGFGPILFGHDCDFVNRAIEAQMKLGYETGPQSPLAGKVAKLIAEMTEMERVTFCNTGSEA